MSVSTLERRFQAHFNCAPKSYIVSIRIREARRRLELGQSAKRVALELGFVDQSHMTRVFKQLLGRTPDDFRQTTEATTKDDGAARKDPGPYREYPRKARS